MVHWMGVIASHCRGDVAEAYWLLSSGNGCDTIRIPKPYARTVDANPGRVFKHHYRPSASVARLLTTSEERRSTEVLLIY